MEGGALTPPIGEVRSRMIEVQCTSVASNPVSKWSPVMEGARPSPISRSDGASAAGPRLYIHPVDDLAVAEGGRRAGCGALTWVGPGALAQANKFSYFFSNDARGH